MLQTLRPVGNKIFYKPGPLKSELFSPFHSTYYQSGTAALSATLLAAKKIFPEVKQPKILIPAYTCPDIISAARYAKVMPILIDFESNLPWMNLKSIQDIIETDSSIIAVVAINFLGIPERITELSKLVENKKILLIEDSAQDFPVSSDGFSSESDFIISSFGKGKPLALLGGGIVLTKNTQLNNALPTAELANITFIERLKHKIKVSLYNVIITPFFYYLLSRLPFIKLGETVFKPLTELKACPQYILNLIESNYNRYSRQKIITQQYKELLNKINSDKIVDLPSSTNTKKHLLRYPILVTDLSLHNKIITALDEHDLGASLMYKKALPEITGITGDMFEGKGVTFNNAKYFASQLITLPTHEAVSSKVLHKIFDTLNSTIKNNSARTI